MRFVPDSALDETRGFLADVFVRADALSAARVFLDVALEEDCFLRADVLAEVALEEDFVVRADVLVAEVALDEDFVVRADVLVAEVALEEDFVVRADVLVAEVALEEDFVGFFRALRSDDPWGRFPLRAVDWAEPRRTDLPLLPLVRAAILRPCVPSGDATEPLRVVQFRSSSPRVLFALDWATAESSAEVRGGPGVLSPGGTSNDCRGPSFRRPCLPQSVSPATTRPRKRKPRETGALERTSETPRGSLCNQTNNMFEKGALSIRGNVRTSAP